ncbi:MAG: helix-turn-helix domain-containing protein [Chloroflexi bacterium]|nr:helix-turn-helix domain-containing protein [Chloroflexota bacterium]
MGTQEAAVRYGVHPETLRRWIARGLLPATRVGNAWVLEAKDVERLLANPPKPGRPTKATRGSRRQ